VKTPTEDKILGRINALGLLNKPIVIAGCLPKINLDAIYKRAPNFSVALDPNSTDKILEAVRCAEKGERHRLFFSEIPKVKLTQPKIRLSRFIETVQISEGCTGTCSFCCVKLARGSLFSYPKDLILDRISKVVLEGVKEIWITSQDNGAYGLDAKTNLVELLKECCELKGEFLIRVGMMNPNHVLRVGDPLVQIYKNDKIFKFLHIPVQSGDDEVLRLMNRFYSVEDFRRLVSSFRKEIPDITLATDVICGFPGETKSAFGRTIALVEEIKPDVVNLSKFFPRPNTPAKRMKQLPVEEVKGRGQQVTEVARRVALDRNRAWLNWEGKILIDEVGRNNSWVGRNYAYKPIVVRDQEDLLGRFVNIRVVEAFPTYLRAEALSTPQERKEFA
jgi:MiaB-like tRNA modifying enzyme